MIDHSKQTLDRIRWSRGDIKKFVGEYLTAPKAHVVFRRGRGNRPLARSRVVLDPKTQLLYSGNLFFMNGDSFVLKGKPAVAMKDLADTRSGPGTALRQLAARIAEWHRAGYLHLETPID